MANSRSADSASAVTGTVSGRVQGVGFRWFVLRRAEELGVTGWVRNCPDGRVEFFAQGAREALTALQDAIRVGPRAALVRQVRVEDAPVDPAARGFVVR